jgi:hypothetical protein
MKWKPIATAPRNLEDDCLSGKQERILGGYWFKHEGEWHWSQTIIHWENRYFENEDGTLTNEGSWQIDVTGDYAEDGRFPATHWHPAPQPPCKPE